jgi:S-disulfanyl-L-cysteine oxidoreductase SoxD
VEQRSPCAHEFFHQLRDARLAARAIGNSGPREGENVSEPREAATTTREHARWWRRNLIGAAAALLAGGLILAIRPDFESPANPDDVEQVALGATLYAQHCSACHGPNLEGEPGWRERLPDGRLRAPPHDASGHTWHHPDDVLFGITKNGLVPGKYAPPEYSGNMPAFAGVLSDEEIWAVLAFIKASWPEEIRKAQLELMRSPQRARSK